MATASRYAKRNFGAKTRIQVSFLGTAKLIVGTLRSRKEGSEEQIHQGQPNRSRIHITQQIYQRYTINTSRIHHKYIDDTQQIRQRNATNTETERLIFATLSLRRNCFPSEDPLWPPSSHLSQTPAATYQWKK